MCQECTDTMMLQDATKCGVPMALCNDNMWGYPTDLIVTHKVRWIEAAAVLPCWTSMIVYYVEGDRGHLMNEEVGQQKYRTVVRGSCISYLMPWEDILRQLMAHGKDKSAYSLPRPQEALKCLHVFMNSCLFFIFEYMMLTQ